MRERYNIVDKKVSILVSGHIGHDPLGRQVISFIGTLLRDKRNEVYVDDYWLKNDFSLFGENKNSIQILEEVWGEELIKNLKNSSEKSDSFEYDFMIYPWLIGLAPDDERFRPALRKRSKIKICYPVYDGSVPPLEWIEMINKNFDICMTPSKYCAHNLKRYGLAIDCFGMEFEVLCKDILDISKNNKPKEKFRFGCIAGIEARKNLFLLVKSFAKAFDKSEPVELVLQSANRGDLFAKAEDLIKLIDELNKHSNISISTKFVKHLDMLNLIASFDAYVISQTTTGFYTTPIEAFAAGLPTILSDIPVHRELLNYIPEGNNIFFAKHNIFEPEYHVAFQYRHLGVKFQATEDEYVKQFRTLYEKRHELYSEKLINQRKECVNSFIGEKIAFKNNLVFHPEKIVIAQYSCVEKDYMFMSENLYKKYINVYGEGLKTCTTNLKPKEETYPEEENIAFQAIEKVSVESQQIFIKTYLLKKDLFKDSRYALKMFDKAAKYGIHKMPYIIYQVFKYYCYIFGKRRKNK